MSGREFIDTNVLVYALATRDSRTPVAERILARGPHISVQVLNEFANVASRKMRLSWHEIGALLDVARDLCPPPRPLTLDTHVAAMAIAAQSGWTIYDALVVASALEARCDTIWSEDLQHGRLIDGRLMIRNPFAA